ncbi:MAG TPA: hypothetical protein VGV35_07600 [Bryobacteraceae bacterium]|nr:hypothetical protein [Bryobacteraceae bacterium]
MIFGCYQHGELLYVARTRNGFTPSSQEDLFKRFKSFKALY